MPNEVLQKTGTQIVWADFATDFSPTAANDMRTGTPSENQIILASLANAAARQSDQVDFGATRAHQYMLKAALEFAATPVDGEWVGFYMAWSDNTGVGWPGGVSDGDAAYTGYSSNISSSVRQLDYLGTMRTTAQATATVQIAEIGIFVPKARYGVLVVRNESDAALHSDDVEMHIVATPLIDEVQ